MTKRVKFFSLIVFCSKDVKSRRNPKDSLEWARNMQKAIENIKNEFCASSLLQTYDFIEETTVTTDDRISI